MQKFSVLMSLYYKEKPDYFHQCMQSISSQSIKPDQIVIVKDGPLTEELNQELDSWVAKSPEQYTIVPLETNQGLGIALATGIEYCKNELIARMDTDDVVVKNRFEKQLIEFAADPELDICGSNIAEFIDSPENVVSRRNVPLDNIGIKKYQKRRDAFNHMTVMYKKSTVLKAGNYQSCHLMEDTLLWVHMIQCGAKCKNLSQPLVYARVGRDMYDRRGGWDYFKKYRLGRKRVLETGYINWTEYLYTILIQLVVAMIPNGLRGWMFKTFLRR